MKKPYEILGDEAETTYKRIKLLNKALLKAKTANQKNNIKNQIEQAKEDWLDKVGPYISTASLHGKSSK